MTELASKLALGTVQFGLDYGIANGRGRVPEPEVRAILSRAHDAGVRVLDTAIAYGISETVLGTQLEPAHDFRIVTKLPRDTTEDVVETRLLASRERLGRTPYGVLLHDIDTHRHDPGVLRTLRAMRERGSLIRVGVSVYRPEDLALVAAESIDLVQVPFSIVDQRFHPQLERLRASGVEIHVRSVLLQGLLTLAPERIPAHLGEVRPAVEVIARIAEDHALSQAAVGLLFALGEPLVDAVVVGVDSLDQLDEHVATASRAGLVPEVRERTRGLHLHDERILLPMNWSKA